MGGGFIKTNPETAYQRVLTMLGNDPDITGWRESINGFMDWHNEKKMEALKQCRVPILAINSDMQPTNVEAFRKIIPSFDAKIVPGSGHVIMWDATDEFNRLLEECVQQILGGM